MTPKEQAAMQQALEALESCNVGNWSMAFDEFAVVEAITALREALDHIPDATKMVALTTEQAQQIEEAFEDIVRVFKFETGTPVEALASIRAARAQEQEPVAYLCDGARYKVMGEDRSGFGRILGLPESLAGQWVALVDATDGKHLRAAPVQQVEQEPEYKGWYCAHCERGVDGSEVTFHEQHEVCGRVITNDVPPKPVMQEPVAWQFFENGKWWIGSEYNHHRQLTEEAGYLIRELYAAPQPMKQEPVAEIIGFERTNDIRGVKRIPRIKWNVPLWEDESPLQLGNLYAAPCPYKRPDGRRDCSDSF